MPSKTKQNNGPTDIFSHEEILLTTYHRWYLGILGLSALTLGLWELYMLVFPAPVHTEPPPDSSAFGSRVYVYLVILLWCAPPGRWILRLALRLYSHIPGETMPLRARLIHILALALPLIILLIAAWQQIITTH